MSKADKLRVRGYIEHILKAIQRIHHYVENIRQAHWCKPAHAAELGTAPHTAIRSGACVAKDCCVGPTESLNRRITHHPSPITQSLKMH
jgi:hypothetical protein